MHDLPFDIQRRISTSLTEQDQLNAYASQLINVGRYAECLHAERNFIDAQTARGNLISKSNIRDLFRYRLLCLAHELVGSWENLMLEGIKHNDPSIIRAAYNAHVSEGGQVEIASLINEFGYKARLLLNIVSPQQLRNIIKDVDPSYRFNVFREVTARNDVEDRLIKSLWDQLDLRSKHRVIGRMRIDVTDPNIDGFRFIVIFNNLPVDAQLAIISAVDDPGRLEGLINEAPNIIESNPLFFNRMLSEKPEVFAGFREEILQAVNNWRERSPGARLDAAITNMYEVSTDTMRLVLSDANRQTYSPEIENMLSTLIQIYPSLILEFMNHYVNQGTRNQLLILLANYYNLYINDDRVRNTTAVAHPGDVIKMYARRPSYDGNDGGWYYSDDFDESPNEDDLITRVVVP